MLTEEDVRRLLSQKTETNNLDYKRTCNWATAAKDDKCEIVKDVLAMANTQDGGQIVFGVDDATFDFVGMDTAADFQSFDPTRVNDFVRRFSNPPFACTVYKLTIDGRQTVVIEVPEFSEVPILCKADANSGRDPRKTILKKSGLYIRTDKPSSELVSSVEEMRDIIGRASRKKREELLRTIEALITGNPVQPQAEAQRAYDAELADADSFFHCKPLTRFQQPRALGVERLSSDIRARAHIRLRDLSRTHPSFHGRPERLELSPH